MLVALCEQVVSLCLDARKLVRLALAGKEIFGADYRDDALARVQPGGLDIERQHGAWWSRAVRTAKCFCVEEGLLERVLLNSGVGIKETTSQFDYITP